MSSQYKVCALYWSYSDGYYYLKHQGVLEDLLNDGWEISRVDAISPTNFPAGAFGATNVYVLEKQSEEKHAEEMADVTICLYLLQEMYGITDAQLNEWITRKTARQSKRMQADDQFMEGDVKLYEEHLEKEYE